MKRISLLVTLVISFMFAFSVSWAQEEDEAEYESDCVQACYDVEDACFTACESDGDIDACEAECQVESAACVERCALI